MTTYSLVEVMKVLDRAEADYIARLKRSTEHDEKRFCLSAVYATREIKKLFKEDWTNKHGGS